MNRKELLGISGSAKEGPSTGEALARRAFATASADLARHSVRAGAPALPYAERLAGMRYAQERQRAAEPLNRPQWGAIARALGDALRTTANPPAWRKDPEGYHALEVDGRVAVIWPTRNKLFEVRVDGAHVGNRETLPDAKRLAERAMGAGGRPGVNPPRVAALGRGARRNQAKHVYIATLLNPADHRPYAITWNPDLERLYVVHPPSERPNIGKVVGEGYFSDDKDEDAGVRGTDCPRSHTPAGVTTRGAGMGLMLYCGLTLAAAYAVAIGRSRAKKLKLPSKVEGACISSYDGAPSRTARATKWWEAQVRRGLAEVVEVEGAGEEECDEDSFTEDDDGGGDCQDSAEYHADRKHSGATVKDCSASTTTYISYTYCTGGEGEGAEVNVLRADKVLESGFVLDANDEIQGDYTIPPPEVLREVDLTDVSDPGFLKLLEDVFEVAGMTSEDWRRLNVKFAPWTSPAAEREGREAGPFRGYARNPVEHGAAWAKFFAEALAAEAEIEEKVSRL